MVELYILNGLKAGQSYRLEDGTYHVGRSPDNDITLKDKTVSRKHLRIVSKESRYFITDLASVNGTVYRGQAIEPGIEVEIEPGIPISMGKITICLGEECGKLIMPSSDIIELTEPTDEHIIERRSGTHEKRAELLSKVSETLTGALPLEEALKSILGHTFGLLRRIDRGAFILIDPQTGGVKEVISKSKVPGDSKPFAYCEGVVQRVLKVRRPLAVPDAEAEEDDELADTLKILNIESVMCVPLVSDTRTIGVIYVDSFQAPDGFRSEDVSLFMDLSQRTAVAIENDRFASEISGIAETLSSDV
jgi:pSer/pThr/pTyr-binding forkhead associated (FHA) protein